MRVLPLDGEILSDTNVVPGRSNSNCPTTFEPLDAPILAIEGHRTVSCVRWPPRHSNVDPERTSPRHPDVDDRAKQQQHDRSYHNPTHPRPPAAMLSHASIRSRRVEKSHLPSYASTLDQNSVDTL